MSKLEIATWNVNSIRARQAHVQRYLSEQQPDVLALQEIKQQHQELDLSAYPDYHVYALGQKTYNGVAFLSREPLTEIIEFIPDFTDKEARCLSASWRDVRLVNVYVPNGRDLDNEHYLYKIQWLEALLTYLEAALKRFPKLLLMGDFNITPSPLDSCLPEGNQSIFHSPPERALLQRLEALGLRDVYREQAPQTRQYSWWDYRMQAFRRNLGLRIDLIYASEALRCEAAKIDTAPRGWERPSDHTPVWARFALN